MNYSGTNSLEKQLIISNTRTQSYRSFFFLTAIRVYAPCMQLSQQLIFILCKHSLKESESQAQSELGLPKTFSGLLSQEHPDLIQSGMAPIQLLFCYLALEEVPWLLMGRVGRLIRLCGALEF